MSTYIQFFANAAAWHEVLAALRNLPEPDREIGAQLANTLARDGASGVRDINLPDLADDGARRLVREISLRTSQCCLRLSESDRAADIETVSLYFAGQRLAQRTVTWPRQVGNVPKIEATETEFRFSIRVVTDLPARLDAIINDLSIHQESLCGELPVFPIALAIPEAENTWGRLPGFRGVFTLMAGDNGKGNVLEDPLACLPMPEPQSLVFLEAVRRPASQVFDLEFLVFGLPARAVRDLFRDRLGAWGQVYLLLDGAEEAPARRYVLASLSLPIKADRRLDETWSRLYGLAGQTDGLLNWPGDTNDPHGWADLPHSRFASRIEGIGPCANSLVVSRRVPLPDLGPETPLVETLEPALDQLPADAYLEIAHAGSKPWLKRFQGRNRTVGSLV